MCLSLRVHLQRDTMRAAFGPRVIQFIPADFEFHFGTRMHDELSNASRRTLEPALLDSRDFPESTDVVSSNVSEGFRPLVPRDSVLVDGGLDHGDVDRPG